MTSVMHITSDTAATTQSHEHYVNEAARITDQFVFPSRHAGEGESARTLEFAEHFATRLGSE